MKTNIGLVEHMLAGLKAGNGYVWGTFGQLCTEALLEQKIQQYPDEVGKKAKTIREKWMGKIVSDCIGAAKYYLWLNDDGRIVYNPKTDFDANTAFGKAKIKGTMVTMPEVSGLGLYKKGHFGVYIGGGWVIEANSTAKGWIKTPLRGPGATAWTNWMEIPGITYVPSKPIPEVADEFAEALKKLVAAGVVSSPDTWAKNAVKGGTVRGEHARQLIINVAKHIK